MRGKVTALLIFHQAEPFKEVKAALGKLAVATKRAHTLADACRVLSLVDPPLLVFTESQLPDGNWAEVVSFSAGALTPVSVIVVGREIDIKLYASAIEMGAFDFIAPPFDEIDLAHVVRCAADHALRRRYTAKNARPPTRQSHPIAAKGLGSA
jgi:DNA-binding NtrC family response regulator